MIVWYCLWECQFKSSTDCADNNFKILTNGCESVVSGEE